MPDESSGEVDEYGQQQQGFGEQTALLGDEWASSPGPPASWSNG